MKNSPGENPILEILPEMEQARALLLVVLGLVAGSGCDAQKQPISISELKEMISLTQKECMAMVENPGGILSQNVSERQLLVGVRGNFGGIGSSSCEFSSVSVPCIGETINAPVESGCSENTVTVRIERDNVFEISRETRANSATSNFAVTHGGNLYYANRQHVGQNGQDLSGWKIDSLDTERTGEKILTVDQGVELTNDIHEVNRCVWNSFLERWSREKGLKKSAKQKESGGINGDVRPLKPEDAEEIRKRRVPWRYRGYAPIQLPPFSRTD